MERTYLILIGIFLLSTTGCRYGIDKIDNEITGLWFYRDPDCHLFSCDNHYLKISDQTFGHCDTEQCDSLRSGPFPYDLEGNNLLRYYPNGRVTNTVKIKWTLTGKRLHLEDPRNGRIIKYRFIKPN